MKEYRLRSVGVDGLWLHLDTADTVAINDSELDVTLVTPGGVPGVLDEPVVLAGLSAPSDGKDGVVEAGTARGAVENTTLVGLEDVLVGLDRDSKGLNGKGGLHLADVAGGDETIVGDVDGGGAALVISASGLGAIARDVWVDGLELSLGGFPVLEGLVLPATTATVVGGRAGNKLLLRERLELASLDEVLTLEGTGGRERPA